MVDQPAALWFSGAMSNDLDTVFAAIADPTRRSILAMLLEDDMAVTDVAEPFDMSLAAISKHLVILTKAGLISQEKRGRVKWCKLEPDAMRAASVWMQGFGQFEPVNLDAFERFLETELGTARRAVKCAPAAGDLPGRDTANGGAYPSWLYSTSVTTPLASARHSHGASAPVTDTRVVVPVGSDLVDKACTSCGRVPVRAATSASQLA